MTRNRLRRLSPPEHDAVQDLADDMTVDESAAHLHKTSHTVRSQIKSAKLAFGVSTAAGLVAKALRRNQINGDDRPEP